MELGTIMVIIGGVIMIFGILFHFQGHSVIGPESSFMYSNPDWVTYGLQIMSGGIIVLIAGVILKFKRN